jgi:CBS domain-containing protein
VEAPLENAPRILHLSLVTGSELRDPQGAKLGRADDLIVRLGDEGYPPVTAVLADIAGRHVFVPMAEVAAMEPGLVTLIATRIDLRPFERRPQEVLLKKDLLDRQLINVDGARLVRCNEIELALIDGRYRVVGVDIGFRGLLRRLLPRRLGARVGAREFLDWASVEPFTGHVPTVRLRVPHPRLVSLHPAQLADLVEAASHREGEEIIQAVGGDPELEADVFEELEESHQLEFVQRRPNDEVAELLTRMESDDAADLVAALPEERRDEVMGLLPPAQRRRLRALLGYDPATAGGLMSGEFVCLPENTTQAEALKRIRGRPSPADLLSWIFARDEEGRLKGAVALADLLRAGPRRRLEEIAKPSQSVGAEAGLEEVARLMTDFDLTSVPVVDADGRMIGVITVDDVLELVLPRTWRRQFGVFGKD